MYVMTNGMMMIPGKFKPADWRLEACVSTRPTKSNGVQSADVPSGAGHHQMTQGNKRRNAWLVDTAGHALSHPILGWVSPTS